MTMPDASPPAARKRKKWPWITGVVVVAVVAMAAANQANKSGSDTPAAPPSAPASIAAPVSSAPPTPASSTPGTPISAPQTDANGGLLAPIRDRYRDAPWSNAVTDVVVDGAAVIARTTLTKDSAHPVAVCEAVRKTASEQAVKYQSVAVRDQRDRTLAHWNGLTNDQACTA